MRLIRFDPLEEARTLMRQTALPADLLEDWVTSLPVDVYEEDGGVVVKADLPGFTSEDVDISVSEDAVSLRAEKGEEKKEESDGRNYLRRERQVRRVARTISLPAQIESEKARASFEDGTLTLTLPKVEEKSPKEVKVKIE